MEGDPIGDLLWGLTVIFGFFVICMIILSSQPVVLQLTMKPERCYIPGAFFRPMEMDSFEARREFGCVKRLVYDDLGAPAPLAPLRANR